MLLNMMRGTGIRGLCGIRSKNGVIIRPFLCVSREEIIQYLEEQQVEYMTDSSNLSDKYTRNFIRLRLLPLMEEINPSVRQALAGTAENLADTEQIYSQAIRRINVLLTERQDNGNIRLSIEKLMQQPAPQTILYELLKDYGFSRSISKAIFGALTGEAGKIFEAAESEYKLLKDRDELIIFRPDTEITEKYRINGAADWHNLPVSLSAKTVPVDDAFRIDKSPFTATLDYDKLNFPLTLRKWKAGDWFIPFGMEGRRKLSDYFSDHKLSLLEKKQIWILCSNHQEIIWIIGKRMDNRFRIDNQTKRVLIINFSPKNCAN
jgi:tRNA(Ile)-lysidine synthase